jgi:hypothetical protein
MIFVNELEQKLKDNRRILQKKSSLYQIAGYKWKRMSQSEKREYYD